MICRAVEPKTYEPSHASLDRSGPSADPVRDAHYGFITTSGIYVPLALLAMGHDFKAGAPMT